MSEPSNVNREPLAIVGMSCRFPGGVSDPGSFWQLMVDKRSGIIPVPNYRWNRERWFHPNAEIPSKMITKWAGFVHDFDHFDAQFFGISPREALRMDPQQRWLLESAWESLEDAGMPPVDLRGSDTGVFIGIASNDYANVAQSDPKNVDVHTNSGSTLSIASNRIAYLFDLKGPAVSVDTACSSALVAVNLACESIWSGQSSMALAGGVNALLNPDASIGFSKASMLSPTGQCFAFDERANGYVRGEGAGVIVIKPLKEAVADGDRIYCTIRAAVINQDGNTSSMTVPGVETQAEMLRIAYDQAGMAPNRVRYMEAHGTGTPVGDPIETRALGQVLAQGRDEDDWCLIGSVKTNVGHLESGSGVAGLMKAALVLHHDKVPPNRNFRTPNPNIPFEEFKLKVATELQPLPHLGDYLPVTAVNSFGFGGTNAHIVLEANPETFGGAEEGKVSVSVPEVEKPEKADRPVMIPLSGRTDDALRDNVVRWRQFLRDSDESLAEIAGAAGRHREHLDHRLVVLGNDQEEICHGLTQWLAGSQEENVITGKPVSEVHPLVFVFTGQGAQWWKMGQALLEREPVFRRTLEEIDSHLQPLAGWSLIEEMTRDEESSQINRTNIAQPAIFGLQVALAELWKSWGITPSRVIGHSVGEVAAAYVAGAYTLEDAVKVIYHRSRLQDTTGGKGRMVAVGISPTEAKKALSGKEEQVQVAVINSPSLITLAGDTGPLEEVVAELEKEGKFVRWLRIDYAFHTHQMNPIEEELLEVLSDIKPRKTEIPFVSTVTGGLLDGTKLDAEYWWRNVREAVLFAPAITGLIRGGEDSFLELGPHPALQNPIQECLSEQGRRGVYFSSLRRKTDESLEILTNLAKLHHHGYDLDWDAVTQSSGKQVDLPKYAWQREKFWLESAEGSYLRCSDEEHPLLGMRQDAPVPTFRFEMDPRLFPWIEDHRFWDSTVFPAAGYGEIGFALARLLFPDENYVVEELEMKKALFISEKKVPTVEVVFNPDTRVFQIFSATGDRKEWDLNSQGVLRKQPVPEDRRPVDFEAIKEGLHDFFGHEEYYSDYAEAGYQFQPLFQHLQKVWRKQGESFAEMVAPEELHETIPNFHIHPAVLDAFLHTVRGGQIGDDDAKATDYFYLPAAIRSIRLYAEPMPHRIWGHATVNTDNEREYIIADIEIYDDDGFLVAEVLGFRADRVEQNDGDDLDKCLYQSDWEVSRLHGTRIEGSANLASPTEIVAATESVLPELYEEKHVHENYTDFLPRLNEAARGFIANAWLDLGWKPKIGDRISVAEAMRTMDVADQHRKLVYGHLLALEEGGILKSLDEETWEVLQVPERTEALEILDQLDESMPYFASESALQRATGPHVGNVLSGVTDPLEILFPGGSSAMMETFYRDGADFPVINGLMRTALKKAIEKLPERRAVRILEVGAGTGSLTGEVLKVLPPDRAEYVFTDNGPLFLQGAKDKFGEQYPFVDYTLFDCEKDPVDQKLEAHSFDIVLASNVIHATADLNETLTKLRRCLAPDGILLFVEVTWRRPSLDNVFGLLPGWWRFADTKLRPHSALLSRGDWESLLTDCGFRDVTSFISSPDPEEDQQACLVARAPDPVELPEAAPDAAVDGAAEVEAIETEAEPTVPDLCVLIGGGNHLVSGLDSGLVEEGLRMVSIDSDLDALEKVLDEAEEEGARVSAIVHALSVDHPRVKDTLSVEELDRAQDTGVRHIHEMCKRITPREFAEGRPNLFFLTRGTMPVVDGDRIEGIASATITGFLRVANNEKEEFKFIQVDLDPDSSEHEVQDVMDEILRTDGELEVAFRGEHRLVRRVHRIKHEELPLRTRDAVQSDGTVLPFRLQIDKPGILTNLTLNATSRREPDPDEIEIAVKAGGINFRDVMKALGMYPGNPVDLKWFGDDFSGEVVRVGSNVTDLKPGDAVVGMAPYCFRSYVTIHRRMVFRKPETMSFAEAATLPTVFLTSHYAINELARMRKGESILIHAGTGGVGQAAIQIARHLGLEIFSTAGTDEKRALLRDMGVDHVLDSRTLTFADEIMEITGGRGVDAVLNSLAGDFIPKNFSVLSTFGRYLEIGKIDIYGNSKIGLEPLRNNISFFVIDLAQHLQDKPEYVAEMFSDLEKHFYDGDYRPLPNKVFPITQVVDAFRYMAAGKHIGKNVLDFDVPEIFIGPATENGKRFDGGGTWLITGGAGGFGLELAGWLAKNGVQHFALMSRSGPREDALPKIAALKEAGCTVIDSRGDVTSQADVERVVAEVQDSGFPLSSVVHGAMVLNDEFIDDLDREGFDRVMLPKVLGAWNLHQATLGIPLENFICFSSFSAVLGAVKQANYNAGNVFLDQLSYHRQARGLAGLTFNWGALKGAGFVERNDKTHQYLEAVGLGSTDMDETLTLFGWGVPTKAAQLGAARVDWQLLARFSPAVGSADMFLPVVPRTSGGGGDSMAARILESPSDKRMGMVEELIAGQVAAVLGTDASRIDKDTPLTNLGLDSLMAIELVNRIEDKLGMAMPMGSVLNGPNIRDLSAPVLEKLLDSAGDLSDGAGSEDSEFVEFVATGESPEEFPLSEGQRALWFLNRLAPDSSAYNLIFSGKFRPLLDIEAMKKAFSLLFERHPLFDVTFTTRNGEPVQVVHKGRTIDFREHDCADLDDAQLRSLISEHASRPFDLERGPVVRLELFRTADGAHITLLGMHHIISDAWSIAVLMQEIIEYYFSVKAGRTPQIDPVPATFSDFVNWEQEHLASPAGESRKQYWMNQMAGAPSIIDLPTDRPRPAVQTFNGETLGFTISDEITEKVNEFAKAQSVTLFTALMSAYEILLHRYCQQEDIVIGVPLAGRNQPDLQGVVGYFVNPVPIRSTIEGDPTVSDYLQANSAQINGALENQQYPLTRIVDDLKVPRDPGRSPLFQVAFSMERVPGIDEQGIAVFMIGQGGHTFHVGDLSMETVDITTRQGQFEITLVVEEAEGNLFGCWQYNQDLFDQETIIELNALYEQVLREVVENPGAPLSSLSLLSSDEGQRVLADWNDTDADYPREGLLHELVAESALSHSDKTAVTCGEDELTYGELNRLANGVARRLVAEGVEPGDNVGVLINRSTDMVGALLGSLKAGASYVPLDPEFPEQRLSLMLEDAAPKVLLTSRELADEIPSGSWTILAMEDLEPSADPPAVAGLTAESLAYLIYTSGSTGTPKGVEIPHRAAINFLESMRREPGMSDKDRLLAVTTLSFDISLLEIFLPLLSGGTTVIARRSDVKDGRRLANLLEDEEITVMQATPATWQMLLDSGWEGRNGLKIFCGGEALPRQLANVLVNSASEVWNLYGPTETTVWSTLEKVTESDAAVTIGRPIGNTQVYVLDSRHQPVPVGFTGDLWIGGEGLARGYRNRADLTSDAFQEIKLPGGKTERLYRTGDLARWTREGVLECLGRVDFQVKLHGVRMELGDIETQLESHPAVSRAVVVKRDDLPGGEGLVGYLIPSEGIPWDSSGLRQFLSERLPTSYLPGWFVELEEFPMTPNRKIDRKRLPAPAMGSVSSEERVAPKSPTERKLFDIFEHQFENADFGITDNFFEMGGDSLMALRIVVETSEAFNRQVPVDAFLRHPTIEQLAYYLDASESDDDGQVSEDALPAIDIEDLDHIEIAEVGDEIPKVDAIALTYVPETLAALSGGISRDQISERWFGGKPQLTNVYEVSGGRIGVIMLPCFEIDFYKNAEGVRRPVLEALEMAKEAGARTVSLTGVIPSATDYGREIASWIEGRDDLPEITTGDATRSATIVRSVEGMLEKSGRNLSGEVLAVVGLGSIGHGTLGLLLRSQPHPKRLILCDPYQDDDQLARIRDEVRAADYKGEIAIVANGGALPVEVYEASLIVASTNLPGILDINSLKPETMVVDYSFPPIFRVADAIQRLQERGDILFTTGGELQLGETVRETIYLPENAEEMAEGLEGGFIRFLAGRDKEEITGCVLVSLLTGQTPEVKATTGLLQVDDALAHYRHLDALGVGPARLQMAGYFLPEEAISAFRNRGAKEEKPSV